MPAPTRALTNDSSACRLIRLDANDPKSPFIVTQEGYSPSDSTFTMRSFYLQHDGMWVDEIARSTLSDSEIGEIVFETAGDAIRVLSGLLGKPLIRQVPVSKTDLESFITRARSGSPEQICRQFLARYRAARGETSSGRS